MVKGYIAIAVSIMLAIFIAPIGAQEKPATSPQADPSKHDMKSMDQRSEGEIAAFLVAVDEHEIAAAKDAIQKKAQPSVEEYARMMIRDHSKHLEDTQKLIATINVQPRETPDIDKLRSDSEAARNRLAQLQGAPFNHAYIDQMLTDHADALNRIDNHYMKATTNAQLLTHLRNTRTTVAKHHEEAKRIQGMIKK